MATERPPARGAVSGGPPPSPTRKEGGSRLDEIQARVDGYLSAYAESDAAGPVADDVTRESRARVSVVLNSLNQINSERWDALQNLNKSIASGSRRDVDDGEDEPPPDESSALFERLDAYEETTERLCEAGEHFLGAAKEGLSARDQVRALRSEMAGARAASALLAAELLSTEEDFHAKGDAWDDERRSLREMARKSKGGARGGSTKDLTKAGGTPLGVRPHVAMVDAATSPRDAHLFGKPPTEPPAEHEAFECAARETEALVDALHADGGHGPVDPFRRRSADRRRGRICRPWAHRLASPPPVPAAAARYAPGQHASFSGGHAGPRGFAAAAHRADLDRAAANSVSDPRATGRSGGLILFDLVIILLFDSIY